MVGIQPFGVCAAQLDILMHNSVHVFQVAILNVACDAGGHSDGKLAIRDSRAGGDERGGCNYAPGTDYAVVKDNAANPDQAAGADSTAMDDSAVSD